MNLLKKIKAKRLCKKSGVESQGSLGRTLEACERNAFKKELTSLLNRYGWDNFCECPDHILADYAERCLLGFQAAMNDNIIWHTSWKRLGEK